MRRNLPPCAVACLAIAAGPAAAQPLIGGNLPGSLVSMDIETAQTTHLASLAVVPQGLAWDPAAGALYAISAGARTISRIDITTGQATLVVTHPYTNSNALAWDATRGLLFAADNNANVLFTVDPATRAVSEVGVLVGAAGVEGLAFDAASETLYGVSDETDSLITIDRDTAAATVILSDMPAVNWRGLEHAPSLDALFLSVSLSGSLWRVDDPGGTPVLTEIGRIAPASAVQGLAWIEEEACYADCDESGELDFFDFLCFQDAFAAGEEYADCDESGELDFFDFLCFQNDFAAGCP
jgi:hypothetical protein